MKETDYENELAGQIADYDMTPQDVVEDIPAPVTREPEPEPEPEPEYENEAAKYIGQTLSHSVGKSSKMDKEEQNKFAEEKKLSRVGDNIYAQHEIRDGWMEVDRRLLQERNIFYPDDWRFYIKPAEVEAIRNWSTIDDENPNSIDDVFNEILKCCLMIKTSTGKLPWGNINSWDRFFFILLIREYTFQKGESKIEFEEECPEFDNPVTFTLNSMALMYDMPDESVMRYYDKETRSWIIDSEEFDLDCGLIQLYLPNLEKDAALKAWMIQRIREKKKVDEVFIKFALWMTPKISKDETISKKQIREMEMKFKMWDTEMFSFMNSVITNIMVTPAMKLIETCPTCGEEVTAEIRFQDGIRSLFNIQNRFKKFGTK